MPLPGEGNAPSEVCGGRQDLDCMEIDLPDLCQQLGICSCRGGGQGSAFPCSRNSKKPECPQWQQKKFVSLFIYFIRHILSPSNTHTRPGYEPSSIW